MEVPQKWNNRARKNMRKIQEIKGKKDSVQHEIEKGNLGEMYQDMTVIRLRVQRRTAFRDVFFSSDSFVPYPCPCSVFSFSLYNPAESITVDDSSTGWAHCRLQCEEDCVVVGSSIASKDGVFKYDGDGRVAA